MKVYVCTASGWEYTDICKVVATQAQADAWVRACAEYNADPKRPQYPDETFNDDNHMRAYKRVERWRRKHPAGEHNVDEQYGYCTFDVVEDSP